MSDSDGCAFDCTCTKCKGRKRARQLAETSDSDSPVENTAKRKKVLRVMSDGAASSSDSDGVVNPPRSRTYRRAPRVVSDEECSSPIIVQAESEDSSPAQFRKKRSMVTALHDSSSSESESDDGDYSFEVVNTSHLDEEGDEEFVCSSDELETGEDSRDSQCESSTSGWESDWASHSDPDLLIGRTSLDVPAATTEPQAIIESESDSSCDASTERCPICLRSFGSQEVATPASCDHSFCAICLQEWAKNINTCPVDRATFTKILVRRRLGGRVLREVTAEAPVQSNLEDEIVEDPTFCEVCHRCDREDRMLLCDGCDSGYHLDCLTPPLETVPIEQWFCGECVASNSQMISGESGIAEGELNALIEDAHAIGWSPPRPRVHRLLPRTRQSERVRATIRVRHALEASTSRPSTSSGIDSQGSASRSTVPALSRPRARSSKRTVRGRKKRKVKSTARQKAGTSRGTRKKTVGKKRRKTKTKSKRKHVRRKRKPRELEPKSVRGRLADQLGIRPPKIPGQVIPRGVTKKAGASSFGANAAGVTLHIFGQPNQLDFFGSGSDDEGGVSGSPVGVLCRPRTSAARNERNLAHRKLLSAGAVRSHVPVPHRAPSGGADLISGILDSQAVWHSRASRVTINRDRTFTVARPPPVPPPAAPIDVRTAGAATTQAPMRGGGTSRPMGDGFGTGGRTFGSAACDGGGFRAGGGGATNGDASGGRGYAGYSPPPAPPPQSTGMEVEQGWKSETDEEDEDIDIYSDIEVGGGPTQPLPPPPLPPEELVGVCEGAASDDDSDTDLVIDDNVPQVVSPTPAEKYDPAEPCDDSSSRENAASSPGHPVDCSVREAVPGSPGQHFESSSSMPEGVVSKAVKEVLKVHLAPRSGVIDLSRPGSDEEEDDECPNFSIYSAVSMDIARNTDSDLVPPARVSMDSPQHAPNQDGVSSAEGSEPRDGSEEREGSEDREGSEEREDSEPTDKSEDREFRKSREGSEDRDISKSIELSEVREASDNAVNGESEAKEDKPATEHDDISADMLLLDEEVKKKDSASLLTVDGLKLKAGLGDIFASDEESLVGGATSPVSATSSAHTPPHPVTGLEGLDTEAISEGDEAAHFDELSEASFATLDEEGEIPNEPRRRRRRREDRGPEPVDYEEGEIVDERPKVVESSVVESPEAPKKVVKPSEEVTAKKAAPTKVRSVPSGKENEGKGEGGVAWKKPSKAKERNYRDGKGKEPAKEKETRREKDRRKDKREDLERYSVRKMVDSKKRSRRRDPFGRDLSRDRSFTRSRSKDSKGRRRSRSPSAKGRRKSLSKDSKGRKKSRSKESKGRRTSRSKESKDRGKRPTRKSPPKKQRSRTKSRHRSRSRSPKRPRAKARSRSPGRPGRSRSLDRFKNRSRSLDRFKNRSRSMDRSKRYSSARNARKRTRSRNRSRLRSRSRSLVRLRKDPDRGKQSYGKRRSVSPSWTPSWSRSGSYSRSSMSSSPGSSRRKQFRSYSRSLSRTWTPEPHLAIISKATGGMKNAKKLTVTVSNTKEAKKKKKDKKKKIIKKKNNPGVPEKRKKRKDKSPPPSKEVFTSGDNILVSVNFNKSSKQLSKEVVSETAKRKLADDGDADGAKKARKDKGKTSPKPKGIQARLGAAKKPRKAGPKLSRVQAAAKRKPMAIIDLDQSPFREQTPSPTDLIVLSDSEDEAVKGPDGPGNREASASPKGSSKTGTNTATNVSESQSPILGNPGVGYLATATGPKTPPEPQVKFSITAKATLRAMLNPLHEEDEDDEEDVGGGVGGGTREAGPNTPPEPRGPTTPFSPTSPDAYDPFDPTKSNSPSPAREELEPDVVSPTVDMTTEPTETQEEPTTNCAQLVAEPVLSPPPVEPAPTTAPDSPPLAPHTAETRPNIVAPEAEVVEKPAPAVVVTAELIVLSPERPVPQTPPKPSPAKPSMQTVPPIAASPVFSLFSAAMLRTPPPVVLRPPFTQPPPALHHLPHVFLTAPMRGPLVISDKPLRLPLPTEKPKPAPKTSPQKAKTTPLRAQNGEQKTAPAADKTDVVDMELESPYSPASSEANDLFNPPADAGKHRSPVKKHKSPLKLGADKFDAIFGASPLAKGKRRPALKHGPKAKSKPVKGKPKKEIGIKMNEDKLQILDELPSSAVELQVKDKYLKKLNRQERVVEEVKLSLKPHYAKKHVTKEEYKDILRRSVPKICHNKSGEINPQKIASLVEAYVKKARYNKKKPGAAAKKGKTQAYS